MRLTCVVDRELSRPFHPQVAVGGQPMYEGHRLWVWGNSLWVGSSWHWPGAANAWWSRKPLAPLCMPPWTGLLAPAAVAGGLVFDRTINQAALGNVVPVPPEGDYWRCACFNKNDSCPRRLNGFFSWLANGLGNLIEW